jgi:solute:Na+ symporter, SSS family
VISEQLVWLFAFIALYWVYCLFWAVTHVRNANTAIQHGLADRALPAWIFVLCATALSFTGWAFMGFPALVYRDGFPFAQVALCAITIPLGGVLFLKRQWMLARRFAYVTPGDMFADYFGGVTMRLLVVLIALVFAVPFVGMQLMASGYLIHILSDGAVDRYLAMWVLTSVVFLYVCMGGLRTAAYVSTLQSLLIVSGMVAIGLLAYGKMGGFGALNEALAGLGGSNIAPAAGDAEGYNAFFAIPGVMHFSAGIGDESVGGGIWTGAMILTFCLGMMGIQTAPGFSMLAFASRDIRGFAPQQVWTSAGVLGVVLLFFAAAPGLGAYLLGGSTAAADAGLPVNKLLPALDGVSTSELIAHYIRMLGEHSPWFMGLLAVCALASVQAMTALYASTTGTMLATDLYKQFVNPRAAERTQILAARVGIGLVILAALLMATFTPYAQVRLGALAIAFGFQLLPALAAVCWFPWITRPAVIVGLIVGMIAVILTEDLGATLARFFGFEMPWGRWPWTIHSAGWGIFCNVVLCAAVSFFTRGGTARERRWKFHHFLRENSALPAEKHFLRPVVWALALAWLFFAVGPGAVIGNDFFGAPNGGVKAWSLGIPSLWAWQVLWWALGVLLIWFLAYKMELAIFPRERGQPAATRGARSASGTPVIQA